MNELIVEHNTVKGIPYVLYGRKGALNRPLVLVMHGAGGNDKYEGANLALNLAFNEMSVVCFDAIDHGERKVADDGREDQGFFDEMCTKIEQNARDVALLIEHLKTDERVDVTRIAVVGISMGAMSVFYMLTKIEALTAAVPILGSPNFIELEKYSVEAGGEGIIPTNGDCIMSALCPYEALVENETRPMLIINGKNDDWVPAQFSERYYHQVKDRYAKSGGVINLYLTDDSHYVSNNMRDYAVEWLKSYL